MYLCELQLKSVGHLPLQEPFVWAQHCDSRMLFLGRNSLTAQFIHGGLSTYRLVGNWRLSLCGVKWHLRSVLNDGQWGTKYSRGSLEYPLFSKYLSDVKVVTKQTWSFRVIRSWKSQKNDKILTGTLFRSKINPNWARRFFYIGHSWVN